MGSGEAAIILVIVGALGSLLLVGLSALTVRKVRGVETKTPLSCPVCARPLPQGRVSRPLCPHCQTPLDEKGQIENGPDGKA